MNTNMIKLALLIGALSILSGCQGDERLSEVSTKQAEAQVGVEKQALESRSKEMESDLAKRQRFYQGVAGVYEGQATGGNSTYNIRIRLVPSLSPYSSSRVRLPEELASDLNNLFFSAQVLQWTHESSIGAVGCRVTNIRPDLETGRVQIASPDCPNFYSIQVSEGSLRGRAERLTQDESQRTARALLDGKIPTASALSGEIQPSTSSELLVFTAERISQ